MHRVLLLITIALGTWVLSDFALAQETAVPEDEAGKIDPGLFWNHIYAAYIVTWLSIIGYTISLWVRRGKGATK